MGRRGARDEQRSTVEELKAAGARVRVVAADVSDRSQLAEVLESIHEEMPVLAGVVHAAGVIDDGVVTNLDWQRLRGVLLPKAMGAWNLHVLTEETPLDFFICFSSMASLLGNSGQASYSAANAFLDALAEHRRARGLAATSINWGPWSGDGMAGRTASMTGARFKADRPGKPRK